MTFTDPVYTAGQPLPAGQLAQLTHREAYTPTLTATTTNPTLGASSTADGSFRADGTFVHGWFNLVFGTSGVAAGSGTYLISIPHAADADQAALQCPVGLVRLFDSSGATINYWHLRLSSSDATKLVIVKEDGTTVTNAVPWTWAASDTLKGSFSYLTDG